MPTVHLIRHGEVANPNHVVYADLPGFNLSPRGVLQAEAAGRRLSSSDLDLVISSPLARARQTATAVARRQGFRPTVDERLVETRQFPGWTGHRWDDIPSLFPGQLERYLTGTATVEEQTETLDSVARRVIDVIDEAVEKGATAIGIVSHQDPVQAARLTMTGKAMSDLFEDPPTHASVITLTLTGTTDWVESDRWDPPVD
jgi:ribonuclease H / adenosylcobalamin/alpha-ribazole phosphatase